MTIVELALHRNPGDRERAGLHVSVDLDRLSPRARALAEIVAASPARVLVGVMLETDRPVREMHPDNRWCTPEELSQWYTPEELDRPHRGRWSAWNSYPVGSEMDPHEYLEQQARSLPLGYFPVFGDSFTSMSSAGTARDDADLITKDQVIALLCELGRPVTAATVDNYRSRPPAGWPQPVRYVGRTPLWSQAAVREYALADGET